MEGLISGSLAFYCINEVFQLQQDKKDPFQEEEQSGTYEEVIFDLGNHETRFQDELNALRADMKQKMERLWVGKKE